MLVDPLHGVVQGRLETRVMAGDADSEAIFTWDSRSHVAARDCQIPECRERRDHRIGS